MSTSNVIIADRDRDLRSTLRVQLDAFGFTCFVAINAREAIEYAAERAPRLVMLDTSLPGLGAYEACASIRRMPACRSVPILLVTLVDRPQIRAAAVRAGASLVLVKPFSVNDLLRELAPLMAEADGAAPWRAFAGGTARPLNGVAEPPRQVWNPSPGGSAGRTEATPLGGGLHMLAVMRRREANRLD